MTRIGCDIVEICRIKAAVERHGRFLQRVYSPAEIEECYRKANPWASLAARFAAKEAVIKALPAGIPIALNEIEIVRSAGEKPQVHFLGSTAQRLAQVGAWAWSLSLSHERTHAMAMVLACPVDEGRNDSCSS
ncbi:holo-ACP synthase [Heliophilum fasciatum]|uniref:Holo-[acyl-carrier-protein] synthase n=1 Tax=Heliophilum fasciatum TaxID=35700 RepID=A0A4R2SCP8_9FIRM|nr:holo-ACP synthase [Heliophilum fasciatum]MCW2276694.1 holo-[acyl-carrier protein] synthase [Heliophilum fasciatum]TCP68925.1 holo-[acyl-carrier protein] synthase [Heliophilum fasciatum]